MQTLTLNYKSNESIKMIAHGNLDSHSKKPQLETASGCTPPLPSLSILASSSLNPLSYYSEMAKTTPA